MSDTSSRRNSVSSEPTTHRQAASDQIDRLCDEFTKSWKSDHRPVSIESMLRRAPQSLRGSLFRELLEIEIEIRTSQNEELDVTEFLDRFPEDAELTDLIFRKTVRRRKLGDYELLEEVGHGGMGVVYRARQVFLNQLVAIKVLSQHYHSDAHVVSRFRREMRMIGGLHHPNIVQALNAGESGDTLYLVMEYVDGFSVQQLIRSGSQDIKSNAKPSSHGSETKVPNIEAESTPGPPAPGHAAHAPSSDGSVELIHTPDYSGPMYSAPVYSATGNWIPKDSNPKEPGELSKTLVRLDDSGTSVAPTILTTHFPLGAAAEIIRQTAFGLSHAFEQGLVHRDIKPANIMVTKKGVVKILDLGLGKFRAESRSSEYHDAVITQFGATMGTVDYMAPEQWENATNVDIRADIYSLGCTLFFMLTGHAPFETNQYNSQRKKLIAHLEGQIPDIEQYRSDCSPEFIAVFHKMLGKDPEDRYQTPEELLKAITPFADHGALKEVIKTANAMSESEPVRIPHRELTPVFRNEEEDTQHGTRKKNSYLDESNEYVAGSTRRNWHSDYTFPRSHLSKAAPWISWQLAKFRAGGFRSLLFLLLSVLICFFVFRHQDTALDVQEKHHGDHDAMVDTTHGTSSPGIADVYPSPSQALLGTTPAQGTPGEQKNVPTIDFPKNVRAPSGPDVVKDLITLPGLTGKWWFMETPWYLPFVRTEIPGKLLERKEEILIMCQEIASHGKNNPWITISAVPYLDSNTLVTQDFLWELTKSISGSLHEYQKRLILELRKTYDSQVQGEELREQLLQHLADFEDILRGIAPEKQSASDYHVLALLQHRIAQTPNVDPVFAAKAKESYKTALQKYAEVASTPNPATTTNPPANTLTVDLLSVNKYVAEQLQLLCHSDYLRLVFETEHNFPAFEKEANALLKNEEASKLFQIEFLTAFGNYSMLSGKNNDQLFLKAAEILEKSEVGKLDHPLSAYLCERYGWSLIDQCKFIEAEQQFIKALRIRLNNLERKNPFAAVYVFHNRHGIAIVRRYLGDMVGAKEQFAKLVHDIKEVLQGIDPNDHTKLLYTGELKARLSNSLERYGDCVLFGGAAASGTSMSRISNSEMKLAADLYDESRTVTESKATWHVVSSKAVIIKSLLGQIEEAKAILDELHASEGINFGSDQNRAEMTFQIAELVYRIREAEREKINLLAQIKDKEANGDTANEMKNIEQNISERYAVLRRFLIQFESDTASGVKFRREPLETQLFCAEMLVSAQLDFGNIALAREELISLETLLTHFQGFEKMRPFLNRFYDLAIRCYNESEADQNSEMRERSIQNQLKYVRQSRFWQSRKPVPTAVTTTETEPVPASEGTFFFYFNSDSGFAIFAPSDKNLPAERFSIPYTRQEIANASNTGKTLELPKALANRIQLEREAGRNPVISYSDAPCWYHAHDAMDDDDWPFNIPIQ